jgi:hypothetical protein
MMRYVLALMAILVSAPVIACAVADPPGVPISLQSDAVASANARLSDRSYVTLLLRPANEVRLAATPGKAPQTKTYAGMITLKLTRPTVLSLELSDSSYVDLVRGGKPLIALNHGHPDHPCSNMHKFVEFRVTAGLYLIQITGAPAAKVGIVTKFSDG